MSRVFDALQRLRVDGRETTQSIAANIETTESIEEFKSFQPQLSPWTRLTAYSDKQSLGSEKFRVLCTRLRSLRQRRGLKTLAIASSMPQEGKSLIASNIAVTLAHASKLRVLLLEGDLRRPVLARQFGLGPTFGFVEWLSSREPLHNCIYRVERSSLYLCPAGGMQDYPIDLLQSIPIGERLAHLASGFDWVVIDCPPMLPLADAALWTRVADGTLIVVRAGHTPRASLKKALQEFQPETLIGVVFNDVESSHHSYYGSYYY